jgi:Ca2+-binding EF-hand superfamily protein
LREAFREADWDDSGAMSAEEMFAWLKEPLTTYSQSIFKLADMDDSGLVDFTEVSVRDGEFVMGWVMGMFCKTRHFFFDVHFSNFLSTCWCNYFVYPTFSIYTYIYIYVMARGQFVKIVCYYCCFLEDDVLKFGFDLFDDDHSGTIDEYELSTLVEQMNGIDTSSGEVPDAGNIAEVK